MSEFDPFRRPEWQQFKGKEYRMPNQFGGIGDNGDGTPKDIPVFFHRNGNGEAIAVPGVNMMPDEVDQLVRRGAVFPLEIAQPCPAVMFETDAMLFGGIKEKEVKNGNGHIIGYDTTAKALQGLEEPLPHGLDVAQMPKM